MTWPNGGYGFQTHFFERLTPWGADVRRQGFAGDVDPAGNPFIGLTLTPRGTGITVFLHNGGALEAAQDMANHSDPRTTKLYDRRKDLATLSEIGKALRDFSARLPHGYRKEGKRREARLVISEDAIPGLNLSEAEIEILVGCEPERDIRSQRSAMTS